MATTSKLRKIDNGIVVSAPTDRVRVLFDNKNHPTQKVILYVGFNDFDTAQACYRYLLEKGMICRYHYKTDRGICKPRRSERVETCQWEIKIHRPDPELVALFVAKSKVETAPEPKPANDRVKVKPIQWDDDPYAE